MPLFFGGVKIKLDGRDKEFSFWISYGISDPILSCRVNYGHKFLFLDPDLNVYNNTFPEHTEHWIPVLKEKLLQLLDDWGENPVYPEPLTWISFKGPVPTLGEGVEKSNIIRLEPTRREGQECTLIYVTFRSEDHPLVAYHSLAEMQQKINEAQPIIKDLLDW